MKFRFSEKGVQVVKGTETEETDHAEWVEEGGERRGEAGEERVGEEVEGCEEAGEERVGEEVEGCEEAGEERVGEEVGGCEEASGEWCGLRELYNKVPLDVYRRAGTAWERLYFARRNNYCGVCGGEMEATEIGSRKCKKCGNEVWPQINIAIIVLIEKGDEALLVRAKNFHRKDFYGLVAGFVEVGESLEEAVVREVREETGLEIQELQYKGSQPWPYPSGLMVGYRAKWKFGVLRLQEEELEKGGWFGRDNLPQLPDKLSIARRLIDEWVGEK